jgi:hypothetical protein
MEGCTLIVFVELKSGACVATKEQKQVRAELLRAGAVCWMARSARAVLMALRVSGVASAVNGNRRDCNHGRDRSRTRTSGCRRRRTWRRGDGRHGSGGWRVSASVMPFGVPLRRVTRGRKDRTVQCQPRRARPRAEALAPADTRSHGLAVTAVPSKRTAKPTL